MSYPLNYLFIKFLAWKPEVYSEQEANAYCAAFVFIISPITMPITFCLSFLLFMYSYVPTPISWMFR